MELSVIFNDSQIGNLSSQGWLTELSILQKKILIHFSIKIVSKLLNDKNKIFLKFWIESFDNLNENFLNG